MVVKWVMVYNDIVIVYLEGRRDILLIDIVIILLIFYWKKFWELGVKFICDFDNFRIIFLLFMFFYFRNIFIVIYKLDFKFYF